MPTVYQLFIICVVASVTSVAVVLLCYALGLGAYALTAAGILSGLAVSVAMVRVRKEPAPDTPFVSSAYRASGNEPNLPR